MILRLLLATNLPPPVDPDPDPPLGCVPLVRVLPTAVNLTISTTIIRSPSSNTVLELC